MQIKQRSYTTPIKALEALSDLEEDEMDHAQQIGLEYLKRNLRIKEQESFDELVGELEQVDSLKEQHILKLLEVLPTHEEEVNALFSKERVKLDDDEIEQIIEVCSSYAAE
ncbi:MAG: hypothetical protein SVU32_05495 [Candidatus Nanohaloarchaea archaeon]|nr:hypothetical protein [Candidatus Nanohaloarchaea archaeon]